MKTMMVTTVLALAVICAFAKSDGKRDDSEAASLFEVKIRFVKTGRAALAAAGYFDPNGVDAAVLQERLAQGGAEDICAIPLVFARSGKEAVIKQVTEYIYPTAYDVQLHQHATTGTNAGARVSAAVEPQSFRMREVGMIVQVTPTSTDGGDRLNFKLHAEFVDEPTWMDYGMTAKWEGAAAYDLPMEQPFFPCVCFDSSIGVLPGRTLVFGGVTDSRSKNEDKFVLAFATTRRVDSAEKASGPVGSCREEPENVAQTAKAPAGQIRAGDMVELDVRYISADRKALLETGYFSTNGVDAAVLRERLMASRGAKLLESPRLVVRSGEEALLKGVVEYIYPTEYEVVHAVSEQKIGKDIAHGSDSVGMAVKPKSFRMREVGTILQVTPTWKDDGGMIDLEFSTRLVGEPEWKDYGAKAKWKGAATYDLPMKQPFFPCRVYIDDHVVMKPGATCVFGGGADRCQGDADKFVFIFVTPRLLGR